MKSLLAAPPREWDWLERRVVFVSGLSNPRHCGLTPRQLSLLENLGVPSDQLVRWNFPFVASDDSPPPKISLPRASWNNVTQYLAFRGRGRLGRMIVHWRNLVDSTGRLDVIALSCGAELLLRIEQQGSLGGNTRMLLLGPVASLPLSPACYGIGGSRDWVARWFGPRVHVQLEGLGHLDYVTDPRVQEIAAAWVTRSTSASAVPVATSPIRS